MGEQEIKFGMECTSCGSEHYGQYEEANNWQCDCITPDYQPLCIISE